LRGLSSQIVFKRPLQSLATQFNSDSVDAVLNHRAQLIQKIAQQQDEETNLFCLSRIYWQLLTRKHQRQKQHRFLTSQDPATALCVLWLVCFYFGRTVYNSRFCIQALDTLQQLPLPAQGVQTLPVYSTATSNCCYSNCTLKPKNKELTLVA
jgi:hypothetical protein